MWKNSLSDTTLHPQVINKSNFNPFFLMKRHNNSHYFRFITYEIWHKLAYITSFIYWILDCWRCFQTTIKWIFNRDLVKTKLVWKYEIWSHYLFLRYIYTSCTRSVARRVRVSLTPETVVTIHVLYQNYKACENLLLYIFLAWY